MRFSDTPRVYPARPKNHLWSPSGGFGGSARRLDSLAPDDAPVLSNRSGPGVIGGMLDNEPIEEPPDSTVNDWMGQEVNRDQEFADRVMERQEATSVKRGRRFNERSAVNDPEAVQSVAPEERPS
jgi:hypothetical protein